VRIYGLPYLGASTRKVLEDLPQALAEQGMEGVEFTVLVSHFGLEGEMPVVPGGILHGEIAPLKEYVDYLALGHWHKPFERKGWIYNPGSLETCAMNERRWHGGFYHVTVDTGRNPKHTARHIKSRRRPFHRLVFPVDEYTTLEALYDGLRARLQEEGPMMQAGGLAPVVEVSLEGILAFDRSALDLEHVRELIDEIVSPLIARPRNNTRPTEFEVSPEERLSRAELERQVLRDLIRRDSRYRGQAKRWANLASEVKVMALTGSPPEAIVTTMRQQIAEMDEE
jgi:DNA repair exonuclease SbcCD nuclease subunit